jgi:hypothetical protein
MTMPGMVMSGGVEGATTVAGRYRDGEFGMAGAWKMALEWDGPAGRGSMDFKTSAMTKRLSTSRPA